jgi:hypothetical protein
MADGWFGLTRITLMPAVAFGGAALSAEALGVLHDKAHEVLQHRHALKSEVVVMPRAPNAEAGVSRDPWINLVAILSS